MVLKFKWEHVHATLNKYYLFNVFFSPCIKFIYKYKTYGSERVMNRNHKALWNDRGPSNKCVFCLNATISSNSKKLKKIQVS